MSSSVGIGTYRRYRAQSAQVNELDPLLIWPAVLLLLISLVMVFSASIAVAEAGKYSAYDPYFFVRRQAMFLGAGVVVSAILFQVEMETWQRISHWLFVLGVVLLIAVLIPHVGREVNGARRWIPMPFANLQPSELMKLFVVLYGAAYAVRKLAYMESFRHAFLPMAGVIAVVGSLLLLEPDFGAFVVIVAIGFGILFLGGINGRLFFSLGGVLIGAFALIIWLSPYRRARILAYLDPWQDPLGKGYQLSHSLIAFGRGELFGTGLGTSVEKLHYLPEAHTDFLLAVIGEELGLMGVAVVIGLFALIVHRAFVIGKQAMLLDRLYASLVAQGIGIWIGFQAFINMGVNVGLLPTKGLTLPLMSFGGSGILANCIALAILLRVDWENRQLMRGQS